jgi:pimeloyl-ACP methyl ester carboxylesterase
MRAFLDENEHRTWWTRILTDPPLNATADSFARAQARAKIIGTLAKARSGDVAPYAGTAFVARDMLSIIRAHGRENLQYWGLSYGSILGMTFASMFPDKVERLVLDGIVDIDNYYKGNSSSYPANRQHS